MPWEPDNNKDKDPTDHKVPLCSDRRGAKPNQTESGLESIVEIMQPFGESIKASQMEPWMRDISWNRNCHLIQSCTKQKQAMWSHKQNR